MKVRVRFGNVALISILIVTAVPARAELARSTKTVIKTSAYGALAGLALGAASYPAHRNLRGIFMGASIGLYLGIAAGAYSVWSEDSGDAPLFSRGQERDKDESELAAFPDPQIAFTLVNF